MVQVALISLAVTLSYVVYSSRWTKRLLLQIILEIWLDLSEAKLADQALSQEKLQLEKLPPIYWIIIIFQVFQSQDLLKSVIQA